MGVLSDTTASRAKFSHFFFLIIGEKHIEVHAKCEYKNTKVYWQQA